MTGITTELGLNAARGEVSLDVDGVPRRLCLTLGALAEMETALGCEDLSALQGRLASASARDLVLVLAALLRGGGEAETAARIAVASVELGDAARAVSEVFRRAGA
ncbi:MAG: GTA-gp10 family protein [Pseudomonadota bacterium]